MNWLRNTDVARIPQRNNQDCSIACLAMALGCTYEEVEEFEALRLSTAAALAFGISHKEIGTIRPLTAQETVSLLVRERLIPIHLITKEAAAKLCDACGTQLLLADEVKNVCARRPGILTVQGSHELHAVYWTGYEIIDPAPGREQPRKWDDYEVLEAISIF